MNVGWIQKYTLNLGWFLLLLGGISLLDRGMWFYAGLIMVLGALLNMLNTLRMVYMGKNSLFLSMHQMYWVNLGGIAILAVAHVLNTKKEISWELLGFLAVCWVFLLIAKAGASATIKPQSAKKSPA